MDEIQTYLGADGLMHCTVCKEPVEAFYPKGSLLEMKKHHRQCACERQAYAEEAQYFKEKERRELVVRNKKICFEEKEMEGFTFQNVDRDSSAIRIAEEYVANWQKMKQNHMGYLFWGPVGTGKSYLAACIANALLEQEVTVKMTNFNTILNDLFAAEDKTEYIRSLNGYELLIIDDLGVERNSEYALENIFSVIDWRYRSGKPLIITTNIPLVQLKQETKIEKKRIYDRILERCHKNIFYGKSCFYHKFSRQLVLNHLQRFCNLHFFHRFQQIFVHSKTNCLSCPVKIIIFCNYKHSAVNLLRPYLFQKWQTVFPRQFKIHDNKIRAFFHDYLTPFPSVCRFPDNFAP